MRTLAFAIAPAPALALALALALACCAIAAAPAQAEKFLDGAYGNSQGCAYARTGESSGADEFFLLTDERVTTATAVCDYKAAAKKTASGFTVTAQCDAEGELGPVETMTLTKSGRGYTIGFPDGTRWGPLPKCK